MPSPASFRTWRDHVMGSDTGHHQLIVLFQPGHLDLITIRPLVFGIVSSVLFQHEYLELITSRPVVFGVVSSVPMILTLPPFA